MNKLCLIGFAVAVATSGCVSKARHRLEVREAFLAGQQQAMAQMQQNHSTAPQVSVHGNVRNSVVPWSEGMTLARAIVAAEYLERYQNPRVIILRRGPQVEQINPKDLLTGHDVPLQSGDIIELVP